MSFGAEGVLVDSNIFIYANDASYPEHDDARRFFEEESEALQFNTIIALESHYGYLKNLGVSAAERILKAMFESRILTYFDITRDDLMEGAVIAKGYNIKTNDATIIASMLRIGISTIATDNVKEFDRHPEIQTINPIGRSG